MSGLEDIVSGWAHQSITIETPGAYDDFGNPSTGTSTSYSAILIQQNKLVRDRSGNQVVSSCQILLPGTVTLDPEATIALPDGTQPVILNVGRTPDFETGNNLVTEIYT
jgi:hypothetical protein